ncbi:MAG: Crp/Fnr family transcriptional regulator [Rhodobacter sp.]|nr:Crp/Fnr family transcriptional regulator [Rhodobacter sp.]
MNFIPKATECGAGLCPACAVCALTGCAFHNLSGAEAHQRGLRLDRGDRLDCRGRGACLQFWVIVEGTAATCTAFEDGRRQILGLEGPGDVICALMAGTGTQNWLEALSDCRICELDLTPQAKALRHDADFLAATFAVAHRRLAAAQAHISTLGRLDSRERVLLFLAQMADRAGRGLVTLHMSREDIADYLGLNAETVSRILSRIKKSGLVKFLSPTEYVVPDMAEIARRLPVPVAEAVP